MKILGLDSSGLVAGVAVVEKDNLLAEYTVNYAIAVAGGPGSFTGLRIGSATAKGLGLALQKPLIQIPTVDGLAYNLWGCRDMVCPLMDARRNQTYTGLYEFTADRMETLKSQCAVPYSFAPAHLNKQRAASVATLACRYYREGKTQPAAAHSPDYLRLSQAERERQAKERQEEK